MNQINLFRATDPISSQAAAEELTRSGRHDFQKSLIFSFLGSHPNCTAWELATAIADDFVAEARVYRISESKNNVSHDARYYYDIAHKRLADLRRAGKARNGELRKCRISGRLAQTWVAV